MATATSTPKAIQAERREDGAGARGKGPARRLRASGRIPATVYGAGKEPVALSVDPRQVIKVLHSDSGHNTILDLELGDESTKAMIVDWQYDPVKGHLLHIDLKRIAMDKRLRVGVPIVLKGEAAGVKQQGGILEHVLREVEIECLPGDIPGHISADVSELVFGQVLRVQDLPHDEKVKFVTDENLAVAHIIAVKEEAPPEAEAVLAEGEVAPAAEPEVIKKGKQEAEEGAEEGTEKKEKEKKEK
jgi:large subunit ribosomal protein L25